MKFNKIERYNKELKEMEKTIQEMESYIENNPNDFGTIGNYETYKYAYNIFKKDKIMFLEEINKINLKLEGSNLNKNLTLNNFNIIRDKLNDAENSATKLLENNLQSNNELNIINLSEGSYKITFAFESPTDEDVLRTSTRKKGLMKLFDLINCGDDIKKLKQEAGPKGNQALISYKEFLKEIVKYNADFTLDTEYGNLKTGLILQQAKNICENLKI